MNLAGLTGTLSNEVLSWNAEQIRTTEATRAPPIASNHFPPAVPNPITTMAISKLSTRLFEGRRQGHSVPATATAFPRQLFSKTLVIFVGRLGHAAVVPHRRTCPRLPETEQYHPGEKFEGTGRNQGETTTHDQGGDRHQPNGAPRTRQGVAPAGDPTDHKHHRKDLDQLDQGSYKGPDEDHPTQKRFSTMKRDSAHQITDPDHIPIALST